MHKNFRYNLVQSKPDKSTKCASIVLAHASTETHYAELRSVAFLRVGVCSNNWYAFCALIRFRLYYTKKQYSNVALSNEKLTRLADGSSGEGQQVQSEKPGAHPVLRVAKPRQPRLLSAPRPGIGKAERWRPLFAHVRSGRTENWRRHQGRPRLPRQLECHYVLPPKWSTSVIFYY